MRIDVTTRLVYDLPAETHMLALVQAARSADQRILSERLVVAPESLA